MMVRGEKAEVLKYLRTLPLEERGVMRRKLLQGLEVIQSRRNSETSSGSESNNESEVKRKPSLSSADAAEVRGSSVFYLRFIAIRFGLLLECG